MYLLASKINMNENFHTWSFLLQMYITKKMYIIHNVYVYKRVECFILL